MRIRTRVMALIRLILAAALGACTSAEQQAANQSNPLSYVTTLSAGAGGWKVVCPLHTVTIIDSSVFYNKDGSPKTVNEFCRGFNSGSRVEPR